MGIQSFDSQWYMDSGASSHMTNTSGNIDNYFPATFLPNVFVGNGSTLPIVGHGSYPHPSPNFPYKLNHIRYSPHLIKNLLSVRKFTTDNNVSIDLTLLVSL